MWRTPMCSLISALGLSFLGATTLAAQDRGWQHAVPADALLFVGVEDMHSLGAGLRASSFGRLMGDPAFAPIQTAWDGFLADMSQDLQEDMGVDPLRLHDFINGPAALVLLDVSDTPDYDEAIFPLLVGVLADVGSGDNLAGFQEVLDGLLDVAASEQGLVVTNEEVDGIDVTMLESPEEGVPAMFLGQQGGMFVAAWVDVGMQDTFYELLDTMSGAGNVDVLAERDDFVGPLGAADDSSIVLYGDMGRFAELVLEFEDPDDEQRAMFETTGLGDLGALTGLWSFADGIRQIAALEWGASDGVIARVADALMGPGPPRLLEMVPADALTATAGHLQPADGFDEFVRLIVELTDTSMADVVEGMVEMDTELGFSLRDDLLLNLDGQFAFFSAEVDSMEAFPVPDFLTGDSVNLALMIGLEDGDAVRTLVETLVDGTAYRATLKREQFAGFDVYELPLGIPGLPLNLHYAILGEVGVLSPSPTLLRDVLRRMVSDDLPSLAGQAAFVESLTQHPSPHVMVSYDDTARTLSSGLRSLVDQIRVLAGPAGGGPRFEIGPDGELIAVPDEGREQDPMVTLLSEIEMPGDEVFRRYFDGPTVATVVVDEAGLTITQTSP